MYESIICVVNDAPTLDVNKDTVKVVIFEVITNFVQCLFLFVILN